MRNGPTGDLSSKDTNAHDGVRPREHNKNYKYSKELTRLCAREDYIVQTRTWFCVLPVTDATGGFTEGEGQLTRPHLLSRRVRRTWNKGNIFKKDGSQHSKLHIFGNVSESRKQLHWKLMKIITRAELFWLKKFRVFYGIDTAYTLCSRVHPVS